MNKFRILGVIAIIAIIANFFGGLDENWRDFKKGFEDGHNSAMEIYEPGRHIIPHHATSVKLNVEPLPETTVDSLSNNRVDWTLPYTVTEIETYAKPSAWRILVMGLAIPGIFLFLIGFCSLYFRPSARVICLPPQIRSLTNSLASKGRRSSMPSPRPTNFTGTCSSCAMAMTMPPLAVPSSLVRMMPVRPAVSLNCRA